MQVTEARSPAPRDQLFGCRLPASYIIQCGLYDMRMARLGGARQRRSADTLPPLVQAWDEDLKGLNRSPRTRAGYKADVLHFQDWLRAHKRPELLAVRSVDVQAYRNDMMDQDKPLETRLNPLTAMRRLIALRQFYQFAQVGGHLATNPTMGVELPDVDKKTVPRELPDPDIGAVRELFERRLAAEAGLSLPRGGRKTPRPQGSAARLRLLRDRAMFELGLSSPARLRGRGTDARGHREAPAGPAARHRQGRR